ncbi:hypothetical protein ACFC09_15250 [Streptomyces sp. NPDC056161]|uniref:hypothetical protein n=1 Tax=Streptomyces sp. NPDC056161 TaxID=3345732 RepID=UPI0035DEDC0F
MVTATLQASELPLPAPMEDIVRALADGQSSVQDPHGFLLALRLRQFVQTRGGLLAVTDLGRAYLAARDGSRVPARARVTTVDTESNTVCVLMGVYQPDQAVTVLLDQLVHATGAEVYELQGMELEVIANVDAERPEEVVLTDIRARPTPLPDTWRKDTGPVHGEEGDGQ